MHRRVILVLPIALVFSRPHIEPDVRFSLIRLSGALYSSRIHARPPAASGAHSAYRPSPSHPVSSRQICPGAMPGGAASLDTKWAN